MNSVKHVLSNDFVQKMKLNVSKFEAEPLDIYLMKMRFNLTKRLPKEVCEYGDFAPVVEKYDYADPELNISTVKYVCEHVRNDEKNIRQLLIYVKDRACINEYFCKIAEGKKEDIIKAVEDFDFFTQSKNIVLHINQLFE